jgi:hypothetical protein
MVIELGIKDISSLDKLKNLSNDQLEFIITFLKCKGNLKAVQDETGESNISINNKLAEILDNLGLESKKNGKSVGTVKKFLTFSSIEQTDSLIIKRIKEKLNNCGGKTTISLFQGDKCEIAFDTNGKGLFSPKIPPANQLTWEAFNAAVEVVIKNGGKAIKGKARSGAKLGSEDLPLDSIEGYIASKVHGVLEGETAFGPGFVICAILDWAEICKNERGYLTINPAIMNELI